MSLPPPQLFGLETEYGLVAAGESVESAAKRLFAPVEREWGSTNAFLPNGGRLYLDVGAHPEYATAECITGFDLLAQDLAGWQLLSALARDLNRDSSSPQVSLIRNNLDSRGNSCGCHENYLLARTLNATFQADASALLPVLVARTLVTGAGWLSPTGEYHLSQRAALFAQAFSAHSDVERPLINTRDEPLADSSRYRRLHVISGDTNISQAATLMKVSLVAATLAALSSGLELAEWRLRDPVGALRSLSRDPSGLGLVELHSGRSISAHSLLSALVEVILGHVEATGELARLRSSFTCANFDPFQAWRAAQSYETWRGATGELKGVMDWQVKRDLLARVRETRRLHPTSPELRRVDLAYHQDSLDLVGSGLLRGLVTPAEITAAMNQAPANTRAHLRSQVIKAARARGVKSTVDWLHVRVALPNTSPVILTDPFATCDERVEALLAQLA